MPSGADTQTYTHTDVQTKIISRMPGLKSYLKVDWYSQIMHCKSSEEIYQPDGWIDHKD